MYLGVLPEEGIEALLLLAKRCLMDKLAAACIDKLIKAVKPDTFDALVKFTCENNIPVLVRGLVLRTPDDVVNSMPLIKISENK